MMVGTMIPHETSQRWRASIAGWFAALLLFGGCSGATGQLNWPASESQIEQAVLAIVNQHRQAGATCGSTAMPPVPALQMNAILQTAARLHSLDMSTNNYFSHTAKDGRSPRERMLAAGATSLGAWGENIAHGQTTAEQVMRSWISSEGHCKNLMGASFTLIGIGKSGSYWTMTLSQRVQ